MSKWFSAAMMAMLAGCGVGVLPEQISEQAPEQTTALQEQPTAAVAAQQAPRDELGQRAAEAMARNVFVARSRDGFIRQQMPRESVGVDIHVTGLLGAESKKLTVLLGTAGCGFEEHGRGTATVLNGIAHLTLNGVPSDRETGVFLILDSNGDAQCSDETDTMWSGSLSTTQADLTVALDLTTLESSPNWMCWAVEQPPRP